MSAHHFPFPPAVLVAACAPGPIVTVTLNRGRDFSRKLTSGIDLDSGELILWDRAKERDEAPTHDMMWLPITAPSDRSAVVRWLRETADRLEGVLP